MGSIVDEEGGTDMKMSEHELAGEEEHFCTSKTFRAQDKKNLLHKDKNFQREVSLTIWSRDMEDNEENYKDSADIYQ